MHNGQTCSQVLLLLIEGGVSISGIFVIRLWHWHLNIILMLFISRSLLRSWWLEVLFIFKFHLFNTLWRLVSACWYQTLIDAALALVHMDKLFQRSSYLISLNDLLQFCTPIFLIVLLKYPLVSSSHPIKTYLTYETLLHFDSWRLSTWNDFWAIPILRSFHTWYHRFCSNWTLSTFGDGTLCGTLLWIEDLQSLWMHSQH